MGGFFRQLDTSGRHSVTMIDRLMLLFGEPPSWRWLLPFQPGGSGDPLSPHLYDAAMCKKWASVATAMQRAQMILEQHSSTQPTEGVRQADEQAEKTLMLCNANSPSNSFA